MYGTACDKEWLFKSQNYGYLIVEIISKLTKKEKIQIHSLNN